MPDDAVPCGDHLDVRSYAVPDLCLCMYRGDNGWRRSLRWTLSGLLRFKHPTLPWRDMCPKAILWLARQLSLLRSVLEGTLLCAWSPL